MSLITESDLIKRDTLRVCQYLTRFNEFLNSEHFRVEGIFPLLPQNFEFLQEYTKLDEDARLNYIFLNLIYEGYHIHYSPELNKLLLEPPPYDSLSKLIAQRITSADPDPSVTYTNSTNLYR